MTFKYGQPTMVSDEARNIREDPKQMRFIELTIGFYWLGLDPKTAHDLAHEIILVLP